MDGFFFPVSFHPSRFISPPVATPAIHIETQCQAQAGTTTLGRAPGKKKKKITATKPIATASPYVSNHAEGPDASGVGHQATHVDVTKLHHVVGRGFSSD